MFIFQQKSSLLESSNNYKYEILCPRLFSKRVSNIKSSSKNIFFVIISSWSQVQGSGKWGFSENWLLAQGLYIAWIVHIDW
jgi:hypothetical protein